MVQRQGEPLNPHGLASLTAGRRERAKRAASNTEVFLSPFRARRRCSGGPEGPRMPPSPAPRSSRSRSPPCGAATFS